MCVEDTALGSSLGSVGSRSREAGENQIVEDLVHLGNELGLYHIDLREP